MFNVDYMTRKITRKSARIKGKSLERDTAKALVGIGVNARRVPMSGALSWMKGDVVEFDIQRKHLHECKNCQQLSLATWWQQTLDQAADEVPVLHFTSNYQPVYTVLGTADFDTLVNAYEQYRPELSLRVLQVPPRKHFWKWKSQQEPAKLDVYLMILQGQEVAVIMFDLYLMLRRQEIKLEGVMQPQPA